MKRNGMKRLKLMKTGTALALLSLLMVPTAAMADIVTTIVPDGPNKGLTAMQIFKSSKLGGDPVDSPSDLDTDPAYEATHIFESADPQMGNVFQIHTDKYGEYDGANLDRQRIELKAYDSSNADVKAFQGDVVTYHWQFRLMPDLQMSPHGDFFHVFQLKATQGDSGAPVLTFSVSDDKLMFRQSPIGSTADQLDELASTPWSEATGRWLDATVTVQNTDDGFLQMVLKRIDDGKTLMSFYGEHFDNWRDGTPGKTQINRPKWGIYRKIYASMDQADVQYTGFEITKQDTANGASQAVDLTANAHVEAEQYFSKTGLFQQAQDQSGQRSNDAYMQIPNGWTENGQSSSLNYKLNVAVGGAAYVHLLGYAPDANSSHVTVAAGAGTAVSASLPVGSWGWTTVPVTLASGVQQLILQTAEDGMKLDKLVISASSAPPTSYLSPKLTSLTLDDQPIAGFDPRVYNYTVKLPFGVSNAPVVKAKYVNPATGVEEQVPVTQLNGVNGTVAVPVTNPLEPVLSKTYTIQFSGLKVHGTPPPVFTYPVAKLVSGSGNAKNTIDDNIATIWDYKVADSSPTYSIPSPPIVYDLGSVVPLRYAFLAYNPTSSSTSYKFDLEVSADNANWTKVIAGQWSDGTTTDLQQFPFSQTWGRYVRYTGYSGKNGSGSFAKYDKLAEIKFAGETKLSVDQQALSLQSNESHQTVVQVTYADGRQPVTVTSATYFNSSDPSIASVTSGGLITAHNNGRAVVQANYDGFSLPIQVTVGTPADTAPPQWTGANKSQEVQADPTAAFITWSRAVDDSGVIAGYRIYSVSGGQYTLLKQVGNVLSTTLEGLTPNTTYQIALQAVDAAGNVSDYGAIMSNPFTTAPLPPDTQPPVTVTQAPAGWSKDNVTLTFTATDNQSGVAKTVYTVNGSVYGEGSTVTLSQEGVSLVSFYSVDQAGNAEQPQSVEVKIDKSAPVVGLSLGAEYALNSTLQLNDTATDDLSGIVSKTVTVTGPQEATGHTVPSGSTIQLDKPGEYSVSITAVNGAGLSASLVKKFIVYVPAARVEVFPNEFKGNQGTAKDDRKGDFKIDLKGDFNLDFKGDIKSENVTDIIGKIKGVFAVRVQLPSGFSTEGFNLSTVTLNGVKALSGGIVYDNLAKRGLFIFDRSAFNWTGPTQKLEFRGTTNGVLVIGQATVKVDK